MNVRDAKAVNHRRHRLGWLGLTLVLFGVLSYFLVFYRFPITRDVPWLNFLIIALGMLASIIGLSSAWRTTSLPRKCIRCLIFSLSAGLTALFLFYIFDFSYRIPPPSNVTAELTTPPEFTLRDEKSQPVALSDFRGNPLVISFFRGHW